MTSMRPTREASRQVLGCAGALAAARRGGRGVARRCCRCWLAARLPFVCCCCATARALRARLGPRRRARGAHALPARRCRTVVGCASCNGRGGRSSLRSFDHVPPDSELAGVAAAACDAGRRGAERSLPAAPRRARRPRPSAPRRAAVPLAARAVGTARCGWASRRRVRVYPELPPRSRRYAALAVEDRLAAAGRAACARAAARGSSSSELREYREGDAARQIDWKATCAPRRAHLARVPGGARPAGGVAARLRPAHAGA